MTPPAKRGPADVFARLARGVAGDPQKAAVRMFGPLDGQSIPGGCSECDAYQTVEPITAGAWKITVHHHLSCAAMRRRYR